MDSNSIRKELRNIKEFNGVFPRNLLPTKVSRPTAMIVNTDDMNEPGEHWIAIILLKYGTGEYFDSFGLPPLHPDLRKYMNKMCPNHWCYNIKDIQDPFSNKCGNFCIAFIKQRMKGISLENFINLYSNKLRNNDKIVLKYD